MTPEQTTHQMTTSDAGAVLLVYHVYEGEPGGVLIVDRPEGLKAHYTTNPGNIAGRMVLIDTTKPLDPANLSDPAELAKAVNAALDDGDDDGDDETPEQKAAGQYWQSHYGPEHKAIEAAHVEAIAEDAKRNEPTPRTYETTTLALELANVEPLYTAARRMISRRIAEAGTNGHDDHRTREEIAADAVKQYVESIMEDQNTRNSRTALLVALANAATCRVDWSDVAEQISEDI